MGALLRNLLAMTFGWVPALIAALTLEYQVLDCPGDGSCTDPLGDALLLYVGLLPFALAGLFLHAAVLHAIAVQASRLAQRRWALGLAVLLAAGPLGVLLWARAWGLAGALGGMIFGYAATMRLPEPDGIGRARDTPA